MSAIKSQAGKLGGKQTAKRMRLKRWIVWPVCLYCERGWPLREDGIHESKAGDLARCRKRGA